MDGIRSVDNSINIQMAAALRQKNLEGSAGEEATESQSEKMHEQLQNAPPSTGSKGTLLNLLA